MAGRDLDSKAVIAFLTPVIAVLFFVDSAVEAVGILRNWGPATWLFLGLLPVAMLGTYFGLALLIDRIWFYGLLLLLAAAAAIFLMWAIIKDARDARPSVPQTTQAPERPEVSTAVTAADKAETPYASLHDACVLQIEANKRYYGSDWFEAYHRDRSITSQLSECTREIQDELRRSGSTDSSYCRKQIELLETRYEAAWYSRIPEDIRKTCNAEILQRCSRC